MFGRLVIALLVFGSLGGCERAFPPAASATALQQRGATLTERSKLAQQQLEAFGSRSIILRSVKPELSAANSDVLKFGLLRDDYAGILRTIPSIRQAHPVREIDTIASTKDGDTEYSARLVGCTEDFVILRRLQVRSGRFLSAADRNKQVAVISQGLSETLFPKQSAVGQEIQIAKTTYLIVGALERQAAEATAVNISMGLAHDDHTILIPLATMNQRIGDRTAVQVGDRTLVEEVQLNEITLMVDDLTKVEQTRTTVEAQLKKRHPSRDWSIATPKLLASKIAQRSGPIVLADLRAVAVTDNDLIQVQKLRDLEILILDYTLVTDTGLSHLHKLRNLKIVSLRNTKVSDKAVSRLREAIDSLQVIR